MGWIAVLARVIFGGYFAFNGLNHFFLVNQMAPYAESKNVPSPRLAVMASGVPILVGGLFILLGFQAWIGAILIIAFLVPVTAMMHNFWADEDPDMRQGNMVNFMKNTALLGASLLFIYMDAELEDMGPWSIT